MVLVGGLHTRLDAFASSWLLREGAASWPRCRGKAPSARCMLHVAARLMTCVPALPGCTASPSAQRSQHSFLCGRPVCRGRGSRSTRSSLHFTARSSSTCCETRRPRSRCALAPHGFVLTSCSAALLVGVARRWDEAWGCLLCDFWMGSEAAAVHAQHVRDIAATFQTHNAFDTFSPPNLQKAKWDSYLRLLQPILNTPDAWPPPNLHFIAQKAKWDSYLKWGIEYDCPIFHGLFKFCRQYAAASIGACASIRAGLPCSGCG